MAEDKVVVWICLEVSGPNSVTHLKWKLMFEWYVVKCASKNSSKKHHEFERGWTTCSNLLTILGSKVNIIGDLHAHVIRKIIFNLDNG